MSNVRIFLLTRDGVETEITMEPSISRSVNIENIVSEAYIISDHEYKVKVTGLEDEYGDIQNVHLIINDEMIRSYYAKGIFYYHPESSPWGCIFADCYGFVRLSIAFKSHDDNSYKEHTYTTGLISVLVKKGPVNSLVKDMVRYVSNNYSALITGDLNRPSDIYELRENHEQNLDSKLILAGEIAKVYERSLGYFKANPRYKTKIVERVDHIERMQYATSSTLQYAIKHPEYLQQSRGGIGIRIGKHRYVPSKTLTGRLEYTEDIFENQIVVSFLRMMINNLQQLSEHVDILLDKIPTEEYNHGDYILSTFIVYESTVSTLREDKVKIINLKKTFEQLFDSYYRVLPVKLIDFNNLPMPTAVFRSLPQYSKIYQCMVQWFTYGNYCKRQIVGVVSKQSGSS